MAIQKTEAFVLRAHPFRTSSLVVTTFSRSFGKIRGVAKGVRKEGVPRPSTFEPFTLLEIVYYEKIRSDVHLISEATVLESYDFLRTDLERLATAYYLVELVDSLTGPHDPHESIFELLRFSFQFLPELPASILMRFFEVRILHEVGLLPHLESCLHCGERNLAKVYFSVGQGAVVCFRCRPRSPDARPLGRNVLQAMCSLSEGELIPGRYASLDVRTEREMREILEAFLSERLPRRLATRRFLNQVQSLKSRSLGTANPLR